MSIATITAQDLLARQHAGQCIDLVDVRTPAEFEEVHIQGAHNVPLDRFDPKVVWTNRVCYDQPLYVVCQSGTRGKQACERLLAAGYENIMNVDGGTKACVQAGIAVVRGRKSMSLERQVRIAAGLLVLTGVILSQFAHPYFVWMSAFIGAGLVFAGVTDTCGMGMMLAKMPWNQRSSTSCATKTPAVTSKAV
jgi:rhodanese-related sulfurtransferase